MWVIILAATWAFYAVAVSSQIDLGVHFTSNTSALPILTLPYGSWRASQYDSAQDIYTFKNIRFAAPPVGSLRWAKPAAPPHNATVQDGTYGNICPQASIYTPGAEDCLFLDLYVPGSAIKNPDQKMPVVVWTYGGAYLVGSKESYPGVGPVAGSWNRFIFVTYNYRLGAFGFLAGTTMERQGLPNTGFYDQRAAFQWVQDYIHLLGGNRDFVTAWGESAGAGSLLHHITAYGGKQNPLFRQVVMQSTTSELLADRRGDTESFYQEFLTRAGCSGQSLACLRSASFNTLQAANLGLISNTTPSTFKPGPAADGSWVRQMPALELASGNYFKNLSGLILSHTAHEPEMFGTGTITSDAAFVKLTNFNIPAYAPSVRQAVAKYYPSPNSPGSPYATQDARTMQYLDDTFLLCNYRYLNTAFPNKTYSMQYSFGTALHSSDLIPTFMVANGPNPNLTFQQSVLYGYYQQYLTYFSASGDPNDNVTISGPPAKLWWSKTTGQQDEKLGNVLNATDWGFPTISDEQALKSRCDFFLNVQAAVTLAGGYVPPGGDVPNNLGVMNSNPSGNYTTPPLSCGNKSC